MPCRCGTYPAGRGANNLETPHEKPQANPQMGQLQAIEADHPPSHLHYVHERGAEKEKIDRFVPDSGDLTPSRASNRSVHIGEDETHRFLRHAR